METKSIPVSPKLSREAVLVKFHEYKRDLEIQANNNVHFLEAYADPEDVCYRLQTEYLKPVPS